MTKRSEKSPVQIGKDDYFANIFDSLGTPTAVVDEKQTVEQANNAFGHLFGIAAERIQGKRWSDLVVPEKSEFRNASSVPRSAFFLPESYHATVVDSEGRKQRTLIVRSILDGTEKVICSLWCLQGETADQLSQQELARRHQELNRLFTLVELGKKEWEVTMDCVDDLVVFVDDSGIIKRCNEALVNFTGRTFQKLVGEKISVLLDDFEIAHGSTSSMGVQALHPGSKRWYRIKLYSPEDKNGELSGTVIAMNDVTVLKLAEQRLIRANQDIKASRNELERAYNELKETQAKVLQQEKMASIGMLAAGVAHEINNPTGFISSNLGTLKKYVNRLVEFTRTLEEMVETLGVNSPLRRQIDDLRQQLKVDFIVEDAENLIDESIEGSGRVKSIVKDLKSFSRSDEKEYKVADINQCLESTLNMVWNEIKYKGTVEKDFGDIPPIPCFPQRLNQVFMNLLVNAAHAIDYDGKIIIRTCARQGRIEVTISDDGCGISEENIDKIFEPFFTTKQVGQGTGLGLSLSYDIIKKHHGDLQAESVQGEGTTFIVSIPIADEGQRHEG